METPVGWWRRTGETNLKNTGGRTWAGKEEGHATRQRGRDRSDCSFAHDEATCGQRGTTLAHHHLPPPSAQRRRRTYKDVFSQTSPLPRSLLRAGHGPACPADLQVLKAICTLSRKYQHNNLHSVLHTRHLRLSIH